jgi:hypothetical protein
MEDRCFFEKLLGERSFVSNLNRKGKQAEMVFILSLSNGKTTSTRYTATRRQFRKFCVKKH